MGLGIMSDAMFALAAGAAGDFLRRNRRFLRFQRWFAGTSFIGLGVTAALATRQIAGLRRRRIPPAIAGKPQPVLGEVGLATEGSEPGKGAASCRFGSPALARSVTLDEGPSQGSLRIAHPATLTRLLAAAREKPTSPIEGEVKRRRRPLAQAAAGRRAPWHIAPPLLEGLGRYRRREHVS